MFVFDEPLWALRQDIPRKCPAKLNGLFIFQNNTNAGIEILNLSVFLFLSFPNFLRRYYNEHLLLLFFPSWDFTLYKLTSLATKTIT